MEKRRAASLPEAIRSRGYPFYLTGEEHGNASHDQNGNERPDADHAAR
jgi:hypothetical protein